MNARSETGGEATFRGMDYQKKFIAFLCLKMLEQASSIKRISCEHNDDIEIYEDSLFKYYQIKSTTENTLRKKEIIDAIKLFLSIESNETNNDYNEYVIVSNANIGGIKKLLVKHPLQNINKNILITINSLEGITTKNDILSRIYILKGPSLEEIENDIVSGLVTILQNKGYEYNYLRIKNALLNYINNMCPGPTNLNDMRIINASEQEQYNLQHKSITFDVLNQIIETNKVFSPERRLKSVENSLNISYAISPNHLNNEQIEEIHDLIDDYNTFSNEDDYKFIYMNSFIEFSRKFDLYRDKVFLEFLKSEFKNSPDKHIILECSFILHNLIISSKIEEEETFIEYVHKEYFPLIKECLESVEEKYENAAFKLEQIIEELKNNISNEQLCELYWKRMVTIIVKINNTGITDNSLWNCIRQLKSKCQIKREWRKWLIVKDELSNIKNPVLKELLPSAIRI